MKTENLLLIGLSLVCLCGLWAVMGFQSTQISVFHKVTQERNLFQKEVKRLREDLAFVESHQKEIEFLTEKGWFVPKNRLIAGEFLNGLGPLLREISYRFDPESMKDLTETDSFKVTQIILEATSALDVDMYAFIDTLLERFPGILIAREITMSRQREAMKGKFVFDWVAMEEGV